MTEEEKKRGQDELKRRRQAENRAKGAHRTSARRDVPQATTGREDTNGALEAAGTQAKAAGIAAVEAKENQTVEPFGPQRPNEFRHDPEMDRQFVDGFIQARLRGPQAAAEWVGALTTPDQTGAVPAQTPPGFLAAQRKDAPGTDGFYGMEDDAEALAGAPETPATPPEAGDAAADTAQNGDDTAAQEPEGATRSDDPPPEQEAPDGSQTLGGTQDAPYDATQQDWYLSPEMEVEKTRTSIRETAGTYTPSSIGEAISMFRAGRGAYLTDEAMEAVSRILDENPELGDDPWKLGTGAHDAKEDEYAFLLGRKARDVLTLLESPHLTDEERGAGIEQYLRDKRAARDGGYYQLDGYYRDNPGAFEAYDGLRETRDAGTQLDRLIGETVWKRNQEAYRAGMYEAVAHERDGALTDDDRMLLAQLNAQDAFADGDAFFQDQYDAAVALLLENGIEDLQLLDSALSPLVREKQLALAQGLDLETFWAQNPDRAGSPEGYMQSALDLYDSVYQKPLENAVAGRTQQGYVAAALNYLTDRDYELYGEGIGALKAISLGVVSGTARFEEGFANTADMLLTRSPEETVRLNQQHYEELYGIWARTMYLQDALIVINNYYSEEEKQLALERIGTVGDIYDLGIDTRAYLHQIRNFAQEQRDVQAENRLLMQKYGTPGEQRAYDAACVTTNAVENVALTLLTRKLSGVAWLGSLAGGISPMGNDYYRLGMETGDWDMAKNAAFGRALIRFAVELMPGPKDATSTSASQVLLGVKKSIEDGGTLTMRTLWMNLREMASSPFVRTVTDSTGRAVLETAGGEALEQYMRYGSVKDLGKVLLDGAQAGRMAEAFTVVMWCTGASVPALANAAQRALRTGRVLTADDLLAVRAELMKIADDPQALQALQKGLIQNGTDVWVGRMIATGAMNTPEIRAALEAEAAARTALSKTASLEWQQRQAMEQTSSLLDAAVEQLFVPGADVNRTAPEVERLSEALVETRGRWQTTNGLLRTRRDELNAFTQKCNGVQNIHMDRLRAQYGGWVESHFWTGYAALGTGVKAVAPERGEIIGDTGDFQQTGDTNDGIIKASPGDADFVGPVQAQSGGKTQKIVFVGNVTEKDLTKELLATKPRYSRSPKQWLRNGGKISIDEDKNWTYTDADGTSVTYIGNDPDFKGAGYVVQEVNIGEFKNYTSDFNKADKMAAKTPRNKANDTWHHALEQGRMQELDKRIHRKFTHWGGMAENKARRTEK